MKIVYTQKGLEVRKQLKNDLENQQRFKGFPTVRNLRNQRALNKYNSNGTSTFMNTNVYDSTQTLHLPDFDNVKIGIIKTARGEIKEKPMVLAKELEKDQDCEVTEYNLDDKNSILLHDFLNERPNNLHKKASQGMILSPKVPKASNSILDIIGTVESPSHWRYFENKKKERNMFLSPSSSNLNTYRRNLPNMKNRHFSPETTHSKLEVGFPFNVEKIFRKHAEEEKKWQKIRYIIPIYYV